MEPTAEQQAQIALGRTLRRLRQPAYTQRGLALAISYSRSTVANVETGRQRVPRKFWSTCDAVLGTDGLLARAHDDLVQMRLAQQRQAAARDLDLASKASITVAAQEPWADNAIDTIAAGVWSLAAADAVALDRTVIADIFDDLTDMARTYGVRHRSETFAQGSHALRQLKILLDGAPKRRDRADIHLAMALTSALMASAAFDLSRTRAAVDLARASKLFAGESGNPSALAWVLGLVATFHNWQGQPSRALREIEHGLTLNAGAAARHRLLHIAARSHALLGNRDAVGNLLSDAARISASHVDGDVVDQIAGEFAFGRARAAACAGAAWLDLGNGAAAASELSTAIQQYHRAPGTGQAALLLGTQFDLVSAQVLADRPDKALEALAGIQHIGAQHHIAVVRARALSAGRRLETRAWRDSSPANKLKGALSQWRFDADKTL